MIFTIFQFFNDFYDFQDLEITRLTWWHHPSPEISYVQNVVGQGSIMLGGHGSVVPWIHGPKWMGARGRTIGWHGALCHPIVLASRGLGPGAH